jgi:hypothetical protein
MYPNGFAARCVLNFGHTLALSDLFSTYGTGNRRIKLWIR